MARTRFAAKDPFVGDLSEIVRYTLKSFGCSLENLQNPKPPFARRFCQKTFGDHKESIRKKDSKETSSEGIIWKSTEENLDRRFGTPKSFQWKLNFQLPHWIIRPRWLRYNRNGHKSLASLVRLLLEQFQHNPLSESSNFETGTFSSEAHKFLRTSVKKLEHRSI